MGALTSVPDEVRVDSVEVSAYTVPTEMPEADGTLAWNSTGVIVVEPRTAAGVQGLGYCFGESAVAVLARDKLVSRVTGADVRDSAGMWESMVRSIRNLGRPGIASMAIAALDIALWDLKARVLGQPLHRVLGGVRDAVPVYGSGGFTTYTERQLVEQLSGWVEMGIPRVKMKIGMDRGVSWRQDLARLRAVRAAIGDDAQLFADANGAYDRVQARRLGMIFAEEIGVTWFEEPVTSDDPDGLRQLRAALPLEITTGEYGYDVAYFQALLERRSVDVMQADVGRCAGVTEWLRAAAVCAAFRVPYSGHTGPSLHLHPACVPPNLRHIEYFHDHVRIDHLLFDGVVEPEGGALRPSDAPGIGLALRRDEAQRFRTM